METKTIKGKVDDLTTNSLKINKGRFKKGDKVNLGIKQSLEHRKKLGEIRKMLWKEGKLKGITGRNHSIETKLKISNNHKLNNIKPNMNAILKSSESKRGKTHIEIYGFERAKKMSEANSKGKKGIKLSLETRAKFSRVKKELFKTGKLIPYLKGKNMSQESKKKLSESHKGKKVNEETKKIIIKNLTYRFTKENRKDLVLPKIDTSIEVKIQDFLKQLKIDFFTHKYMNIEHGYQCDILIPNFNLVIECDGDYWHKYPIGRDIDKIRTSELIEKGFKVLRLWEHEIKVMDLNKFEEVINNGKRN